MPGPNKQRNCGYVDNSKGKVFGGDKVFFIDVVHRTNHRLQDEQTNWKKKKIKQGTAGH